MPADLKRKRSPSMSSSLLKRRASACQPPMTDSNAVIASQNATNAGPNHRGSRSSARASSPGSSGRPPRRSRLQREARLVTLADFPHERRARRAARADRQDGLAAPRPSHFRVRPSEVTRRVEVQERRPTQPEDAGSGLVKVKAGPTVKPGTYPIEPDVAESWTQPNDTTYVFKLRKDVRWHPKPPVNGRELTAEDVKFTYDRFLTVAGNPNRPFLASVDHFDVLDLHTVPSLL